MNTDTTNTAPAVGLLPPGPTIVRLVSLESEQPQRKGLKMLTAGVPRHRAHPGLPQWIQTWQAFMLPGLSAAFQSCSRMDNSGSPGTWEVSRMEDRDQSTPSAKSNLEKQNHHQENESINSKVELKLPRKKSKRQRIKNRSSEGMAPDSWDF